MLASAGRTKGPNMRVIVRLLLIVVLAPWLLAGCLPENRVSNDCRTIFDYGMITRIEQVVIDKTYAAEVSLAENIQDHELASVPSGAIVGSIAGSAKEQAVDTAAGIELTVGLASGGEVVVVHQRNEKNAFYRVGDRVRFMRDCHGTMWVWPENGSVTGAVEKTRATEAALL